MKQNLPTALRNISASRYSVIRDAYFKAAEGLAALVVELERADADLPAGSGSELRDEHLRMSEALAVFDRSQLGRYL